MARKYNIQKKSAHKKMHSPRTKQAKKLSPAQLSQTYSKISDLEVEKEKIFAETNKARYQIDKLNEWESLYNGLMNTVLSHTSDDHCGIVISVDIFQKLSTSLQKDLLRSISLDPPKCNICDLARELPSEWKAFVYCSPLPKLVDSVIDHYEYFKYSRHANAIYQYFKNKFSIGQFIRRDRLSAGGAQPTKSQKQILLGLQDNECFYCRKYLPAKGCHLDHVNPLSKNGSNHISNRIYACKQCNLTKSNLDINTFLKKIYAYRDINWIKETTKWQNYIQLSTNQLLAPSIQPTSRKMKYSTNPNDRLEELKYRMQCINEKLHILNEKLSQVHRVGAISKA